MEQYLSKGLRLIMSKLDIDMLLAAMEQIATRWRNR